MGAADVVARSFYRLLLLAYPRSFRRRDGAEAADVFAAACRDSLERGGMAALARRWLHAVLEVPRRGVAERFRRPSPPLPPRNRRRTGAFVDLLADLRFAARSLRRRPGWTLAIAATLALGIGANTAIFSVIDATLLASSPWPDTDRLVRISARLAEEDLALNPSLEELLRWRDEVGALERLEAVENRSGVLAHVAGARRVGIARVTPGYLHALGVVPLLGRFLVADDGRADAPAVTVMPEALWRRLYDADPSLVGDSVELNGVEHIVAGVIPSLRGLEERFFVPLPAPGTAGAHDVSAAGHAWLREGVTLEEAQAQLAAVSAGEDERWGPYVGELSPWSNTFWDVDEFRTGLVSLVAAVFLVLSIACVNVANLLLAAAGTRRGELAVRAALGAGRGRLVRFMLAESLLLAALGAALGLAVAFSGMRLMQRIAPGGQLGDALALVELNGAVLAYASLIALLAALTFGLLPALRCVPEGRPGTLRDADGRTTGSGRRLGGLMVAVETALALVLLIAAGLTARSFLELRFVDPGFDADRIMSLWITPPEARYPTPEAQNRMFESVEEEISRVPGVEAAALAAGAVPPSDLVTGGVMTIAGREHTVEAFMTLSMVEAGLLDFMGIPLLAGRDINQDDVARSRTGGEHAVVINRSLARRFWPDGDAIGARFRLSMDHDQRWNRVVGIAVDVRQRGLEAPDDMLHLYRPLGIDRRYGEVLVRLAEGARPPVAELRAAISRVDPQVPTETLDVAVNGMLDSISGERFRAALFGAFGLLAVVLAALGVSGVIAYNVVQRTREMGIRLALGAEPRDVRRLMLLQGGAPVLAGIGLGLLLALAVTRMMGAFLHGIAPTDPPTFAVTAATLAAVGLVATWIPTRRATSVDPLMTLRNG